MTVQHLIDLLKKHPADTEVWYIEDFYGELDRPVEDFDIIVKDGKIVIGCK